MYKNIKSTFDYNFSVNSNGLYLIYLFASCSKKNLLRVEIDGEAFAGVVPKSKNQFFNIPSAWNGNKLKGLIETKVFILKLSKGDHVIRFVPKGESRIETEPKIVLAESESSLSIFQEIQSEPRDCQPWLAAIMVDLPIMTMDIAVSCKKRFLDSDEVKLIINERVQKSSDGILRGKNWLWRGSKLNSKIQTNRFYPNLPKGLHYIELWADRTPVLKSFDVQISLVPVVPLKRIPTAQDPKWTGNFLYDTEEIILARLIFGEANNQPAEAKEWVGWTVINRAQAKSWWPNTVHGVILQPSQYDVFTIGNTVYKKIIDPLGYETIKEPDKKSWFECCEIATNIVRGKIVNPTTATHFHSFKEKADIARFEKFIPKGKFLKKIGDLYFYSSPN